MRPGQNVRLVRNVQNSGHVESAAKAGAATIARIPQNVAVKRHNCDRMAWLTARLNALKAGVKHAAMAAASVVPVKADAVKRHLLWKQRRPHPSLRHRPNPHRPQAQPTPSTTSGPMVKWHRSSVVKVKVANVVAATAMAVIVARVASAVNAPPESNSTLRKSSRPQLQRLPS